MAAFTPLNFGLPADGKTTMTAGFFMSLQNNINAWGAQFLPLVGGALSGPITWSAAQQFPAQQVILPSNPAYPHQNTWRTVWDHINDPSIHLQKGAPLAHAASHEIGGSDVLYGDSIAINAANGSESIKTYIDTQISSAISGATANLNYASSLRYEIGGADPLYGNKIAINSANPSQDIKTYVDSAIAGLGASNGPTPTITSLTLNQATSSIAFTAGSVNITSLGATVFKGDGTNLFVQCKGAAGAINFGNQTNALGYGSISSSGYAIGQTVIGPNSGTVNGPLTANGDVSISRAQSGSPHAGAINFGQAADAAYLSFNADVNNQLFLSTNTTIGGNLTLSNGGTFTVGSVWSVLTSKLSATVPMWITNGSAMVIAGYDANNGSIELRSTNATGQPFIDFTQNSNANGLTPDYTQRIILSSDGTMLSTTGTWGALKLTINSGYTSANGDLGLARSASSAKIYFGTDGKTSFDFGVTGGGVFTFTANSAALSKIAADGSYVAGSSSYGPLGASVSGIISSTKSIEAATGVTFAGASGFVFSNSGGNFDTGLFSNGAGDLRLYTGAGTPALALLNGNATFAGSVNTGAFTATTIASSGNTSVGGNLTITGTLYAGNTQITKFRTKSSLYLGWNSGASSTGYTYPTIVVPAYSGGTIDAIRLSALTADSGTQTTVNILKNGAVIGSVALPNGQKTAKNLPVLANTPIAEGDVLQAVCTQAGTSTGVTVTLEISQYLS